MAEVEPLLLHEDLEALDGSVVRVQQELREGEELRRPVPAVTAVNYHWTTLSLEIVEVRQGEDGIGILFLQLTK